MSRRPGQRLVRGLYYYYYYHRHHHRFCLHTLPFTRRVTRKRLRRKKIDPPRRHFGIRESDFSGLRDRCIATETTMPKSLHRNNVLRKISLNFSTFVKSLTFGVDVYTQWFDDCVVRESRGR